MNDIQKAYSLYLLRLRLIKKRQDFVIKQLQKKITDNKIKRVKDTIADL